MDFVSTLNPNEINPGQSFTSAFQGGLGAAVQLKGQQNQKEISMAQLGQQAQEFSVTTELEKQRLAQAGAVNMAQIASINANTDYMHTLGASAANTLTSDINDKGVLADDYSKMHTMPTSDLLNYQGGSYTTQAGRAQFEGAKAQILGTVQGQQAQQLANADTTARVQLQQDQLSNVNYAQQYQIPIPKTANGQIDHGALNTAVVQDQIAKQTARARAMTDVATQAKLAEIQAQGAERLQYAQALTQSRNISSTGRFVSQHYQAASKALDDLNKAGATDQEKLAAQAELDRWSKNLQDYQQSPEGQSDAAQVAPAAGTPQGGQPQGNNMQNPSGLPQPNGQGQVNPAQALWQQSLGK